MVIEEEVTGRILSDLVTVVRSVARRRLVETENPSVCATVDCEVCGIAIAP
jgi:hypothetical protein